MIYRQIILVGYGSLLSNILKYLVAKTQCRLIYCETESNSFSDIENFCTANYVERHLLYKKKELISFLASQSELTLVLSIHNKFILTRPVLDNQQLNLINFHPALLPKHPGRNPQTWAIYEMDEYAGVTWHQITKEVDAGDIISQDKFSLTYKSTALTVTVEGVKCGLELFKNMLPTLLNNTYQRIKQKKEANCVLHLQKHIPNDGIFELNWPLEKQSAFLRSMDYGLYEQFSKPKVLILNQWFLIDKYIIYKKNLSPIPNISFENFKKFEDENFELYISLKLFANHE